VGFNAVVMEPNWSHMPQLVDLVADLGGDEMAMQELLPNSTGYDELKIEGHVSDGDFAAMVEQVKARAQARGVNIQLNLHQPYGGHIHAGPIHHGSKAPLAEIRDMHMDSLHRMHPGWCPMAMNYLKVTPDGKVYPCCRGPEELEMGNVLEESMESIWNGPKYQEFRRQMFTGEYPTVCKNCVVLTGPAHFPGNQSPTTAGTNGTGDG
jgi:radical SAM protein with 4Fe4S-binding SPASM domain